MREVRAFKIIGGDGINLSNIKNEFSVEGELDSRTIVFVAKTAVEETAKLYGQIFARMVSEYALQFEAKKLGEKPPENISGLGAVTDYKTLARKPPTLVVGMNRQKVYLKVWYINSCW